MIETELDTRAFFDTNDFALESEIDGDSETLTGIFDQNFDQTLNVNGRRTGFRIVYEDLALKSISIGTVLVFDKNTSDEQSYTVRALEQGARTVLLILEPAA